MNIPILTKEEIEKLGFIYESDETKCKTIKLALHVPRVMYDEFYPELVKQTPFKYVNQITETPNPYEGNFNFCADPKMLVTGHN